jgi:hypothetical protein
MKKVYSTEEEIVIFFLLLACVFGAALRIFPIARVDFPLVDGGMFYVMVRNLQAANFVLPEFTSYNNANIPFAYPPLGFYIAGLLNTFTDISILGILQWLPVTVTLLNIPLYYLFAKQASDSVPKAALATFLFALTPSSYWWDIVGGGLTRSLGTLFFTATALSVYQMYRLRTRTWIVLAILSAAGAVLSHPAWSLQSVVAAGVLWYFFGRDKQGILYSGIVAAGVVLLTAPWWITVIQYHGVQIFMDATKNTFSRLQAWTVFFKLLFTDEYTPVIALFGMCGFFIHLARRKFFLPVWVLLCLLAEPRGGSAASIFAFSILAATTLSDGIISRLTSTDAQVVEWTEAFRFHRGRLFFGFFTFMFLYNAFQMSNAVSYRVLSAEERTASEWARSNTSADSRFLILDVYDNPVHSPLPEWFPALSERRSVATIQGTEWLAGEKNWVNYFDAISGVHSCLYQTVECVYKIQDKLPDDYDYIVLSIKDDHNPLLESLNTSGDFTPVYSSVSVHIFRVNR